MYSPYALPFEYSYNFIEPGLAMGCAMKSYDEVFEEFDIIVFCAGEWQPSVNLPEDKTKRVIRYPFDDSAKALTDTVTLGLHKVADEIVSEHKSGKRIVITCLAGRNRSGILTALVLMKRFGLPGKEAVKIIKERRGDFALTNSVFTSYLLSLK